jgi:hypothetical protein
MAWKDTWLKVSKERMGKNDNGLCKYRWRLSEYSHRSLVSSLFLRAGSIPLINISAKPTSRE